ncbi:hypothetical protein QBC37DRAFT_482700 [Rhypophila decipiens]|uniref:DUF6546 domain-containing protein n=1 Tax=Rhypophila decipiens TaxID=261697 RepID=A0AAN6Y811_9PEZI|nr:hypothetical protein QBC37DRAFT_482700 [Rhypophila decipiens]
MINKLVILRRTHRAIAGFEAIVPLVLKFTRVESFHYEPWHGLDAVSRKTRQTDHQFLMRHILSRHRWLAELHIYQDINPLRDLFSDTTRAEQAPRDPILGKNLCVNSRHLRRLSVANMVNAEHFFYPFWPGTFDLLEPQRAPWMNLQHLTLNSPYLCSPGWRDLIITAGRAAKRMPQLQMMELFEAGHHYGFLFRYERLSSESKTFVAYSINGEDWGYPEIGEAATDCWKEVAWMHHPLRAGVDTVLGRYPPELLPPERLNNHLSILPLLMNHRNLHRRVCYSNYNCTEEQDDGR